MKVRYRNRAREDIESIYDWIAKDSFAVAQRVEDAIHAAAKLLGKSPELGVETGYMDARRWPIPRFFHTIFYRIDGEADYIDVLRVVAGKRVRNPKHVPE